MSGLSTQERERLLQLLGEEHGTLSAQERDELDDLCARLDESAELDPLIGELLVAFDAHDDGDLPDGLRDRLVEQGQGAIDPSPIPIAPRSRGWLIAASLLIAAGAVIAAAVMVSQRNQQISDAQLRIASLQERIESNNALLETAQERVAELNAERERLGDQIGENQRRLAEAAEREVDLATQLAEATSDLDSARLEIARYEQPADPAELAANRQKLLEVPDTIRVAWSPFDLPEAPAEQGDVQGDVVWNDELQTGYLRFVGLDVNDPGTEQYQVWVIDERGMEQKVSGGVFNATADGEVIVPIEPGIDVGRVALFAITIEEPGGTWVPDLRRRVVVAPRGG